MPEVGGRDKDAVTDPPHTPAPHEPGWEEAARPAPPSDAGPESTGAICPHLALIDDPATRISAVHRDHACFHPSVPSLVPDAIQARFCLSGRYPRCPVYRGVVERPPRPVSRWRQHVTLPRAIIAIFVVVIPAVLGTVLALSNGDEVAVTPASRARVDAPPAVASTDTGSDGAAAGAADAADATDATDAAPVPDDDAQAVVEDDPPPPGVDPTLPPIEQLRVWPQVAEYVVVSGDTLFLIAQAHDTTAQAIAVYNDLANTETIFEGQVLRVPAGFRLPLAEDAQGLGVGTPLERLERWGRKLDHTVEAGDTLFGLAAAYSTTAEAIAQLNDLSAPYALSLGQVLQIPAGFQIALGLELPGLSDTSADGASGDGAAGDGAAGDADAAPDGGADGAGDADADAGTANDGTAAPDGGDDGGDAGGEEGVEAGPVVDPAALAALQAWPNVEAYTVRSGDSLFAIALDFGTTVEALALLNGREIQAALFVGTTLQVPVGFTTPLYSETGASGG